MLLGIQIASSVYKYMKENVVYVTLNIRQHMLLLKENDPNANCFLTSSFVYQNPEGDSLIYSNYKI